MSLMRTRTLASACVGEAISSINTCSSRRDPSDWGDERPASTPLLCAAGQQVILPREPMQLRAGAEHTIELAHLAVVHEIEIELDRVAQFLRLRLGHDRRRCTIASRLGSCLNADNWASLAAGNEQWSSVMASVPETMSAIGISTPGGPDVLQAKSVPTPRPGPGQILITVAAAGVNRPDLMQRAGSYPPPPGHSPLPGLEVAGEVAALGEGVTRWQRGDKVCAL